MLVIQTVIFWNQGIKYIVFLRKNPLAKMVSMVQAKKLSINKNGHAIHDLDPVYLQRSLTKSDSLEGSLELTLSIVSPEIAT
jgi:hypothetical protein